ncbi:MAG: hypothetical protein VCA55_14355, partial [Verrucomicrobiales bacterium]
MQNKSPLSLTTGCLALIGTVIFSLPSASGQNLTINVSNINTRFTQIQADNTPIANETGFLAIVTTSLTPVELGSLIQTEDFRDRPEPVFTQFGTSSTFGGPVANNLAGYFSLNTSAAADDTPFKNNNIYLIGGDGPGIADSSAFLLMRFDQKFVSNQTITLKFDDGEMIWGNAGGTNSLGQGLIAMQMDSGILPPEACELKSVANALGEELTFDVELAESVEWTATSLADWLTITDGASGTG